MDNGSSLGPTPIGLKLGSMSSITVRSTLRSVCVALIFVHFALISVRTDLKVDRTVMELIEPSLSPMGVGPKLLPKVEAIRAKIKIDRLYIGA